MMDTRYLNLEEAILATIGNSKHFKPYRILEIGTYDGSRALSMIRTAKKARRSVVHYYGLDLFEDLTAAKSAEEMSKTKPPPPIAAVKKRIGNAADKVTLVKGISFQRLQEQAGNWPHMDIIFIDGGHSLDTVYRDWMAVQCLISSGTVVVFDDYYHHRDDVGCGRLTRFLSNDPGFVVEFDGRTDKYEHTGVVVSMVRVTKKPDCVPLPIPSYVYRKNENEILVDDDENQESIVSTPINLSELFGSAPPGKDVPGKEDKPEEVKAEENNPGDANGKDIEIEEDINLEDIKMDDPSGEDAVKDTLPDPADDVGNLLDAADEDDD